MVVLTKLIRKKLVILEKSILYWIVETGNLVIVLIAKKKTIKIGVKSFLARKGIETKLLHLEE